MVGENMVDGSTDTLWSSNDSTAIWLMLDLEDKYQIERIELKIAI
jgi:hypothetical protein